MSKKRIDIDHILKHLFDKNNFKNYWDLDRYPFPLVKIKDVKVKEVYAKTPKSVNGFLHHKKHR